MSQRSVPAAPAAALALAVILSVAAPASSQERAPRSEKALAAYAPPAPPSARFGDGAHGVRLPTRAGEPAEPALSLEVVVSRTRPGRTTWVNVPLRRTIASILDEGGAPMLVFSSQLRAASYRPARATPRPLLQARGEEPGAVARARPPTGARAGAPERRPAEAGAVAPAPREEAGGGPGGRLGAELDPLTGLDLPSEMPAVRWPIFVEGSCTGTQPGTSLWAAKRSWALAHHHVWRAYQLLEFIGESPGQYRDDYWSDGYRGADTSMNWSPYQWFGGYAGYRQDAIRKVVKELWDRFRSAEFDGIPIRVKCPTPQNEPENPGNICFTHEPGAHHVVKGWINLCEGLFEPGTVDDDRAAVIAHEMLHHARVSWEDGDLSKSRFLGDTHLHGHGDSCLSGLKWQKMYGPDRARHLAAEGDCWHRDIAMRNNDNYAWFVTRLGQAVRSGRLRKFPTEGTPWQTPGGTGNECSETPHPPPGEDIQDPEACFKAGDEMICPGGGGGGGGVVLPDACLSIPTGPGG